MMRLPRPRSARRRESTIALINIVFLMLIFFLIAGTVAPPLDRDVTLITTETAERAEAPDALFVTSDGEMRVGGRETDPASYVEAMQAEAPDGEVSVKLAADRELPAEQLIDVVAALREAGAAKVSIVTERSAE